MFSFDRRKGWKSPSLVNPNLSFWLGAASVASITLIYLALWWNRYFGPNLDGYFAFYGHLLHLGKIPYRDFYLHVPPLVPFESALIESVFGPSLIWPRLLGGFERLAIAGLGYCWLARLFHARHAAIATIVMVFVGSGDSVDVLFLYNHHAVFWALLAGLLASFSLERRDRTPWFEFLAGICTGLAFLTKQTVGLGVSVALPAALLLAYLRRAQVKEIVRRLGTHFAGWLVPVTAAVIWLFAHDALRMAIDQIFLTGPSSKGPVINVLVRAITGAWQVPSLRVPSALALAALLALALLFTNYQQVHRRGAPEIATGLGLSYPAILALAIASIAIAVMAAGRISLGMGFLHLPQRFAVFFALYGTLILSLVWGLTALRRVLEEDEAQNMLFAFISFASAYMFATSWPSFEPIAIPGLGLIICSILSKVPTRPLERVAHVGVWTTVAVTLCLCTWLKLEMPYKFAGWTEPPVRGQRQTSDLPGMEGFRLDRSTITFVETATRLIREHSIPGDSIFVYPHLPVLYLLSDRQPTTFAMIHWFDVCDDEVAWGDAERLLQDPPAVLVDFALSEEDYRLHEAMFRAGRESGQRHMRTVLRELETRYTAVKTLLTAGSTVTIWVRPDRLEIS